MTAPVVAILAAGQGTRMRSATPKLLHLLCGRPLIAWPVAAAEQAGAGKIVVVDGPDRALESALSADVVFAIQEQAHGTGDALEAAAAHIDPDRAVIVLNGDGPLLTPEAIRRLLAAHEEQGAAATIATATLEDPSGYGRVVRARDGTVERVVETKVPGDATELELRIREVNTGLFAFDGGAVLRALSELSAHNAQGERYLPDVLPALRRHGRLVAACELPDASETLGVNDRAGLAAVRAVMQARIHRRHMLAGVTIVDPASTVVDADVEIGADTVVAPFTSIHGGSVIGEGATIGPLSTLIDARVGDRSRVVQSYLDGADVGERVSVGPFAYLRPGAILRVGSKAGTFVEIKNSDIGAGTKVPHLSYIGDADIGEETNVGAGTITANYDGYRKHRTSIGSRVKVSVDTMFVAPVSVGDDAYTAAGSVITGDVPPGALGVARARQSNVDGYAERRREREERGSRDAGKEREERGSQDAGRENERGPQDAGREHEEPGSQGARGVESGAPGDRK